ncbi:MAG: ubiquinone/menaquinone biosynthesis C-methylase UbiE [Pseudohongiellaceae bacterium]
MITDNQYWDKVYSANKLDHQPSSFAQYVEKKYFSSGMSLLELGCGNGRDSLFFVEKGKQVQALDLSSKTIESLSSLNIKNVEFLNQDFSSLTKFSDLDYVYSRFTMHSIDEETEEKVFSQLSQVLKVGGFFLMEARSSKDEKLEKTFGNDHFRRYLNFHVTVDKLEKLGFQILEKRESQGLSPYKQEDPFLIRIVAQRL